MRLGSYSLLGASFSLPSLESGAGSGFGGPHNYYYYYLYLQPPGPRFFTLFCGDGACQGFLLEVVGLFPHITHQVLSFSSINPIYTLNLATNMCCFATF